MPVMYSFCFWFSVRLGAIIIGAFSLLQAFIAIVVCSVGIGDLAAVTARLDYWLSTYEMLALTDAFRAIKTDPKEYLTGFLIFLLVYATTCLLLIYGAFKCNVLLIYPFIGVDLVRLIIMSVNFVFTMMIIKENDPNLGLIIGSCVMGGFAILYLYYMWFCTISLCQIIKEIQRLEEENDEQDFRKPKSLVVDDQDFRKPRSLVSGMSQSFRPTGVTAIREFGLHRNIHNPFIISRPI